MNHDSSKRQKIKVKKGNCLRQKTDTKKAHSHSPLPSECRKHLNDTESLQLYHIFQEEWISSKMTIEAA